MGKIKVAIIGLGYVGLPTFVAIAKTNLYNVVGYDVDEKKIALIKKRISPIEDLDVKEFLKTNLLSVSNQKKILQNSKIFIINF